MTGSELEPTVRALRQLSPQSQSLVASTVKQLAEREPYQHHGILSSHD